MKIIIRVLSFTFFSVLFFHSSGFAASPTWTRHVLTEGRDSGAQLLLVIDVPANPQLMQSVSYRHIFKTNERLQWQQARQKFLTETRPSRDVQEIPFTDTPLWPLTKNFWTWDDEQGFSTWMGQTITPDFLVGSGIRVDCADFYITLRWIYAHDHGLPAANTLAGSGRLFGSWQTPTVWQNLPTDSDWRKDKRFKAALLYLLDNSYTHSLLKDLYPVALTRQYLTPGAVNLYLRGDTGHTQPLIAVGANPHCPDSTGCLLSVWGNEPADEKVYLTAPYILNLKSIDEGGFLRYRWPTLTSTGWKLTPASQMPGYSLEQYQFPNLANFEFENIVYKNLGIGQDEVYQAILKGLSLEKLLLLRLEVTVMGYFVCHVQICPEGSSLYNDYSTPSRDQRIRDLQQDFLALAKKIDIHDSRWRRFKDAVGNVYVFWPEADHGKVLNDYIFDPKLVLSMDSNPQVTFEKRWGWVSPNSNETPSTILLVWWRAWKKRLDLVKQAQSSCPSTGCDPSLNTKRLDDSLRQVRLQLQSVSSEALRQQASHLGMDISLCTWNPPVEWTPRGFCLLDDYIFSSHNMVEKMSSDPRASFSARVGF